VGDDIDQSAAVKENNSDEKDFKNVLGCFHDRRKVLKKRTIKINFRKENCTRRVLKKN
jgi:hypothetical protein